MNAKLLSMPLIACLALAGCLGGESEAPPGEGKLVPGSYVGDYGYVPDSLRQGFEAELILDRDGTYRNIWIKDTEAVYDEHGSWSQDGRSLYLRNSTEDWADYRVFWEPKPIEDDTCSLVNPTDTSFIRNEWIPIVLRKRQWTEYRLRTYPKLADGTYSMSKTVDSVTRRFRITLDAGAYRGSVLDSIEISQTEAHYYQVGSFLQVENSRERERDSTGTQWADWFDLQGHTLQRLRAVSDTGFDIWEPGSLFLAAGWDHYSREP